GAVALAREPLAGRHDRAQEVDRVVVAHALEHGTDALEAHAGVDVPGGQVGELALLVAVLLDEDQVPELDVARAAAVDGAAVRLVAAPVARRGAAVDVDLGARAARPGLAHLPEVLGLEAEDAVAADVGQLGPERGRLVVGRVDGGVELVLGQLPHPGEELPGPLDRLALVVVAEGPVAERSEEHTSELQSLAYLVCRLLLEKKK